MTPRHTFYAFLLSVCIGIGLGVACRSLPAKQTAVVSLQASELALEAAHDAERLLCNPAADQTQPIRDCTSNAASVGLTTERHRQLAELFSLAFSGQIKAAQALQAWRAGDPPPMSFAEYRRDLIELLTAVGMGIPQTQPMVLKIQEAIDDAAKVAGSLGVNR